MTAPSTLRPLWSLALSLALAACATAPIPLPTTVPPATIPAATAAPTAAPASTPTALPPPTAAPTATTVPPTAVPPTPTPPAVLVGYAGDPPPAAAKLDAAIAVIQQAAKDFGWKTKLGQGNGSIEGTVLDLAQQGAQVIVTLGQPMQAATLDAARKYPNIYFIGLYQTGADLPANVLLLDDATAREDQAGFIAGMAAGFVTKVGRVAVVGDPTSPAGLRYRNGFLHGVRYTCPRCRLDNLDVQNAADVAGTVDIAAKYELYGVDVFFAAAGEAGDAALVKVTQAGAWGIGSGRDVSAPLFNGGTGPGADHLLASVYLDPDAALAKALTLYQAGQPLTGTQSLSAANGALVVVPGATATGGLSALDRQELADMVSRLADGSFETGIDPVTGVER